MTARCVTNVSISWHATILIRFHARVPILTPAARASRTLKNEILSRYGN